MANSNGRPKSEAVKLSKAARERFEKQLATGLDDIFKAVFEAATKDKDASALALLVNRAVPIRKGAPVSFLTRPLTTPGDCAEAFGDILSAVGKGELTPEEGDRVAAIIDKRIGLFATIELQAEIETLKQQLSELIATRGQRPALTVVE